MTPNEASKAALWQIPVVCEDITYRRIVDIIKHHRDQHDREYVREPHYYQVRMESMSAPGRSFTNSRVEKVRAADEESFRRMLENYENMKGGAGR